MLQQQIDKLKFKVENFCSSKDVISKVKKKKNQKTQRIVKFANRFLIKDLYL